MSVGVDIGGTGTRFVALTARLEVVGRASTRTPGSLAEGELLDFFRESIASAAMGRPIASLGIGASGPVDEEAIRNPATLPAFSDQPLVAPLAEELGVPVVLENDTVVAAIGEYEVGAARGVPALLQVTLGTGIGTALLIDGVPWRGGDGRHPEGGHLSIAMPSPPCYCGRERCWEQAASRAALQAAAAMVVKREPDDPAAIASAAELAVTGGAEAAAAAEVFDRYGSALADGLGNLLELYRPTHVVLGGGASVALPLFEATLLRDLDRMQAWLPHFAIAASALDDFGGAIGAAVLGRRAAEEDLALRA